MRARLQQSFKAITRPISLYPHQLRFAMNRSLSCGLSLSRYFQELAEYDQKHNIIARRLEQRAKEAAKS